MSASAVAAGLAAAGVVVAADGHDGGHGADGAGTWRTTSHGPIFVKLGTGGFAAAVATLQCELTCLEHLHALAEDLPLVVPRPVAVGTLGSQGAGAEGATNGFIAMQKLDLGRHRPPGGRKAAEAALGRALAQLHARPTGHLHDAWGFPVDGSCGAGTQLNNAGRRAMTWPAFWREFRLGHKLAELKAKFPQDTAFHEAGAQLCKRLDELFGGAGLRPEDIPRSILHGDLWQGNVGYCRRPGAGGDAEVLPCVFDPAAYYGHSEADLGIVSMFSGFGPAFHKSYHEVLPPAPGFAARRDLYELHHHLNHWEIFGAGYRGGAMKLVQRLLAGMNK